MGIATQARGLLADARTQAEPAGIRERTVEMHVLGLFVAGVALSAVMAGAALLGPLGDDDGHRLRFWTLQVGGFGLTGAGLWLGGVAGPLALVVAFGVGAAMAALLQPLLDQPSGEVGLGSLVGATARVVLSIGPRGGKVAVRTSRGCLELPARSDDGGLIERGATVYVGWVEAGEVWVWEPSRSERSTQPLGDDAPFASHDLPQQDGGHRPAPDGPTLPG